MEADPSASSSTSIAPAVAADADGTLSESLAAAADMGMKTSILEVEQLLGRRFKNKTLLVEALTHPSYAQWESNRRLEFFGDAVLGLAITGHIFRTYPHLNTGQLTNLRSANVSNNKFARVAVRHNLYSHLRRRNTVEMDRKVHEFSEAVQNEADELLYNGEVPARKVLANMVESIAAAVYVDCEFDLQEVWRVFERLLDPITEEAVQQQHPVSMLNGFCQKKIRKTPEFQSCKEGTTNVVDVYVDGKWWGSGRSEYLVETAKLTAATAALQQLKIEHGEMEVEVQYTEELAQQHLNQLCTQKSWPQPVYKVEEEGPDHEKLFTCSVEVVVEGTRLDKGGDKKSRKQDAKSSAAFALLNALKYQNQVLKY